MFCRGIAKKTLYYLLITCLVLLLKPAWGYNYPQEMIKQRKAGELILQQMLDGYHWELHILPGKISLNQPVRFHLKIIKMDSGRHTLPGPGRIRPYGRFLKAFAYLDKEPPLLDGSWREGEFSAQGGYFQWSASFSRPGDYLLDLSLQSPPPAKGLPADLVTFYFTVSRKLASGQQAKYLSDKICRQCHRVQFISWRKSKKARAFELLKPGVRAEAKLKAGLDPSRDYSRDPTCLPCHTTGYGRPGGFISLEKTPALANIQCEACHGAGSEFVWVMRRKYSFAHSEVDDLGHRRFATHRHTPRGHVHSLDPASAVFCRRACHNPRSPTYRPLRGSFKEQVKKSVHRLYQLKFKHWDFEQHMGGMSMAGLPRSLFILSAWVMGALSLFFLPPFFRAPRPPRIHRRWELFKLSWLKNWFSSRFFQLSLQLPLLFFFLLVIVSGLWGEETASHNLATILSWNIWWVLIVFDVALLGRWWCAFCPWDAIASWLQRLSLWRRRPRLFSLGLPWPKRLGNIHLASALFVLFTWLQINYQVAFSPRMTAYLGLAMLGLAVAAALLFEGKPFCRYGCFVGRICGLYSLLSPLELRRRNPRVCAGCKGRDCFNGNARGYPCPTGQRLDEMSTNTYCLLCAECVKSCRYKNVSLNLRPPASGLLEYEQCPGADEMLLITLLWAVTVYHGLSMTPVWPRLLAWLGGVDGWGAQLNRNLALLLMMALPLLALAACAALSLPAVGPKRPGAFGRIMRNFSLPVLALALFYHLAHNLGHFVSEAAAILPALSDPLGRGWDLLGTAAFTPAPLLGQEWIWGLQLALIMLGHCYALCSAAKVIRRLFPGKRRLPAVLPLWLLLVALSFAGLWLLSLPMQGKCG